MVKETKEPEISNVIGGTLNILGLKIDLGKLLSAPEDVSKQLEELREKLKKAGGKETLSDEEWRKGKVSVTGQIKTRGILGDREYHIGTAGPATSQRERAKVSEQPETIEPPVDVFPEGKEIVVIAEVPGIELADLELKVNEDVFSFSTKSSARRNYHKEIKLSSKVDGNSLKATCKNGILEVHLPKKTS
jgi:HSP20 family protein